MDTVLRGGSETPATDVLKTTVQTGAPLPAPAATGGSPYHALSAQEVWDDLCVDVVQQAPGPLVVVPRINQELPPGVVVNEWADLRAIQKGRSVMCAWLSDLRKVKLQCASTSGEGNLSFKLFL